MTNSPRTQADVARARNRRSYISGVRQHSVAWFLGAIAALIVVSPFLEEAESGRLVEAALLTIVLSAAVLAIGGRRRTLITATVIVVPAVLARWFEHLHSHPLAYLIFVLMFLLFVGFVVFELLRFIMRSPRVNSEVLCAAVGAYLLLAMLWAAGYTLAARLEPSAFSGVAPLNQPLHGFNALYFSVITITTIGYGDITPTSGPVRMLAMLEAIIGTMYMAVLVARLVSAYTSRGQAEEPMEK